MPELHVPKSDGTGWQICAACNDWREGLPRAGDAATAAAVHRAFTNHPRERF
jgi:hypothetical protein